MADFGGDPGRTRAEAALKGSATEGFEEVRDALHNSTGTLGAVQLCVMRGPEVLVDLWTDDGGFGPDSLVQLASTSKGILALLAARLIESGSLDVSTPVGDLWPEFGRSGKARITVEQLLTHTAGLPGFPREAGITATDLGDWERCVDALAGTSPVYSPGRHAVYHGMTYGYLVGEVIRRVTGRSAGRILAEEIAAPLGLDVWIGLPPDHHERVVPRFFWESGPGGAGPVRVADPEVFDPEVPILGAVMIPRGARRFMQSAEGLAVEIPSSNGLATARSLARLYGAMIGEIGAPRLLSETTVDLVRAPRTRELSPHPDLPGETSTPFGLGFMVDEAASASPFLPGTFGHAGTGGTQGFAHVPSGISVGYTSTGMAFGPTPDPRLEWIPVLAKIVRDLPA